MVAATTRAYEHRDRLTEVERQLTAAFYYSTVDIDAAKEEAAYRRVLAINPDNMVATNNLSLLLSRVGRPAEAESLIAPLVRASPDPGNMMLQLLLAQVTQRHDDDVKRTLATMEQTQPDLPLYMWGRGIALHAMQDYEGADRAYRDLELKTRNPIFQSLATLGRTRVALTRGKLADAERQIRAGIEVNERRGLPGKALGSAAELALATVVYRGDSAGALRIMETALKQHPLDSIPTLDRPGADIALVYAVAGQHARARQLLGAYESQVPEGIRRGRWEWHEARGWLALVEGRPREAVAAFIQGRNCGLLPRLRGMGRGRGLRAGRSARFRARRLPARRRPRHDLEADRRRLGPGAEPQAAGGDVRSARRQAAGTGVLRAVRGAMEGGGSRTAADGARGAQPHGAARRGREIVEERR